jgi:hypothetical protein
LPSPAAPSRTASAVPIQSTIGRPAAVAEPAPDTTSDAAIAARRRGRSASTLITIAGDVPALKPLTAPEAETQCKHSLESGDADVALETARRAWHLEPNLGRYLLLMASTDLSEKQRDLILLGAYQYGTDPKTDYAIDKIEAVEEFLRQRTEENEPFEAAIHRMITLFE